MKRIKHIVLLMLLSTSVAYSSSPDLDELFNLETVSSEAVVLKINEVLLKMIVETKPETFNFKLPLSNNDALDIQLFKSNIYTENFKISTSSGQYISTSEIGVLYTATVNNTSANFLFLENTVFGVYKISDKVYEINKTEDLYYTMKMYNDEADVITCLTNEEDAIELPVTSSLSNNFIQDKPINVFVEVNYKFPYLRDAKINKLALVVFNMGQVAQVFKNEEITIKISEIFVWDTESPYGGGSKKTSESPTMPTFLTKFKKERKRFNGDVALLFVEQSKYGNGIASRVGGLCSNRLSDRMAVTKTYWDYTTEYPRHSRGYKIPAHELGHLFGSGHTHSCLWNNNKTVIDTCRGRGENCQDSDTDYAIANQTHTLMSYCKAENDLQIGFGVQPGNKIRNFIANTSCLETVNTWDETLMLHHLIASDPYETYNAKYKAKTIYASNTIEDNANAFIVAKEAIYLKEGFIAKSGSNVELKITEDDIVITPEKENYETLVRTYSIDDVINNIIEDDTVESVSIIDVFGNEIRTINIASDADYLDVPRFFNGFYMVKTTFKDGSVTIRKK